MARIDPDDYDLVQVIGMYTPLVKVGSYYRGDHRSGGHDSLVVDPRKNLFNWNSRGIHGDVFEWVKAVHRVDFRGAVEIIERCLPKTYARLPVYRCPAYTKLPWSLAEKHWANLGQDEYTWWQGRGIDRGTVDRLLLGVWRGWYTIPVPSWGGTYLANYKLRARHTHRRIRYRQYNRNLEPVLYVPFRKLVRGSDTVVFVAGEIKAIVLASRGIPAVSSCTGCSTWRPEWAPWFQDKRVIQCFDPGEQEPAAQVREKMRVDMPGVQIENRVPPYDIDDWLVVHGASIAQVEAFLYG